MGRAQAAGVSPNLVRVLVVVAAAAVADVAADVAGDVARLWKIFGKMVAVCSATVGGLIPLGEVLEVVAEIAGCGSGDDDVDGDDVSGG